MRHLKRRWALRVGDDMTKVLHNKLVAIIQGGTTTIIERQSNRVSIHKIVLDKETYTVVYDRHRKQVVTVLPKEEKYEIVSENP